MHPRFDSRDHFGWLQRDADLPCGNFQPGIAQGNTNALRLMAVYTRTVESSRHLHPRNFSQSYTMFTGRITIKKYTPAITAHDGIFLLGICTKTSISISFRTYSHRNTIVHYHIIFLRRPFRDFLLRILCLCNHVKPFFYIFSLEVNLMKL